MGLPLRTASPLPQQLLRMTYNFNSICFMGQLYVLSSWDGNVFFRLQAHLHHYLQVDGMEECVFAEAVSSLSALIQEYDELDATKSMPVLDVPRLSVALWKKQLNMHCYLLWLTFVFPLCPSHCLWFRKSSLFFTVSGSQEVFYLKQRLLFC